MSYEYAVVCTCVKLTRHETPQAAARGRSSEQDAWSTVTIIPASTSAQASVFRPEVVIAGRDTKVLIDQIHTIDVSYVAGEMVDYLTRDDMAQVEHGLSRYFGLLR
jgi:mRNA interferase MazF